MINKNTTNKSFISAWHYLQDNGVENNSFMLELKNKKLIDFSYEKFMNEERTKEETIKLREMILKDMDYLGISIDNEKNYHAPRGENFDITGADSKVKVVIIPTNEELVIAKFTEALAK